MMMTTMMMMMMAVTMRTMPNDDNDDDDGNDDAIVTCSPRARSARRADRSSSDLRRHALDSAATFELDDDELQVLLEKEKAKIPGGAMDGPPGLHMLAKKTCFSPNPASFHSRLRPSFVLHPSSVVCFDTLRPIFS